MNEPEGAAIDMSVADEIQAVTEKLLDNAGEMYSKDEHQVREAKAKISRIVSDAKDMVSKEKDELL